MIKGRSAAALLAGASLLAAAAMAVCASAARPQNRYIGTEACFNCHIDYARQWAQLDHSKALVRAGRQAHQAGCEACHGPGERHATVRAARAEIISWAKLSPEQQSAACLRCHQPRVTAAGWGASPHAKLGVSCLFCHEAHRRTGNPRNLQKPQGELCGGCHAPVASLIKEGKHHAVPEGMGCTACHDPHSAARPKLLRADRQVLCRKCHAPDGARVRPTSHQGAEWFKEHGKTAKADVARCGTCHAREKFCTPCHGTEMPHPGDWVMKHGATALKAGDACARCHDRAKCATCHAAMAPRSHRQEGFRARVADEAKGKEALCQLCHGTPMPHPENWIMEHKAKGAGFAKDALCFTCHQKEAFCKRCHPDR
ncbi:MAG: hypothetical protein HY321_10020 [Armatimonadetes bacterium]|nr:hypothetical protein [Armatimonadota bacterium]